MQALTLAIGKQVVLKDGRTLTIDIVMYATGYEFNMPFMDKDDKIVEVEQEQSGGRFAYPMYKKLLSAREPAFNVIGLLSGSPVPLAGVDRQIMFSLCLANGWVKLPSEQEMIAECDEDIRVNESLGKGLDKVFK